MKLSQLRKSSGLTLVELLIVIAVLGILAAVVLVAIKPLEQLARGRDAGRKSNISQLSNALQSFSTQNGGVYALPANLPTPAAAFAANWMTVLTNGKEIQTVLPLIGTSTACALVPSDVQDTQNGYCYITNAAGDSAVIFDRLESQSEKNKCAAATPIAYFLWSSADGKAGVVCSAADPTALSGYTYK